MSIYYKEMPEYFDQCMRSIWDNQIAKPDQIILVQNGELTNDLYDVISSWKGKLTNILTVVVLEKNSGLANALNAGLKYCTGDFVARMDTDDISLPERFKKQMIFLEGNSEIDVVGSWMSEIDENNNIIKRVVEYPKTHEQCLSSFRCRNPLAHPAVMFRKSFFDKAGHYPMEVPSLDDVAMWHQGFINGCMFANVPEVYLQYRRTSDFYKRRGSVKMLVILLQYRIFRINPDMKYGVYGNFCALAYFGMQILPSFVKKILYSKLR